MGVHKCAIGILDKNDFSELVTLDELNEHISENISHNKRMERDPLFRDCKDLRVKVWTLKEYADKRRNTDLTRFYYCPICGSKIEWGKMVQ